MDVSGDMSVDEMGVPREMKWEFPEKTTNPGHVTTLPHASTGNDEDDDFRFKDELTHESHLRQNGILTWFCNAMAIIKSLSTRNQTQATAVISLRHTLISKPYQKKISF